MKLQFIFSLQFERTLQGMKSIDYTIGMKSAAKLEAVWKKEGKDILRALEALTHLKFKEDAKCYINSQFSVSDPLCVRSEDTASMRDNLIHEMIHLLLLQNPRINKSWQKFHTFMRGKYPDASPTTITHVVIHALHLLVARKVTPHRVKSIKSYTDNEEYVRTWTIIDEMGPDAILQRVFGVSI